jgi:hypothetical protein
MQAGLGGEGEEGRASPTAAQQDWHPLHNDMKSLRSALRRVARSLPLPPRAPFTSPLEYGCNPPRSSVRTPAPAAFASNPRAFWLCCRASSPGHSPSPPTQSQAPLFPGPPLSQAPHFPIDYSHSRMAYPQPHTVVPKWSNAGAWWLTGFRVWRPCPDVMLEGTLTYGPAAQAVTKD